MVRFLHYLLILASLLSFAACSEEGEGGISGDFPHVLNINGTDYRYHTAYYSSIASGSFELHQTETEFFKEDILFVIRTDCDPVFDPAETVGTGVNLIEAYYYVAFEIQAISETYRAVSGSMQMIAISDESVTLEFKDAVFEFDDSILDGHDNPKWLGKTAVLNGTITFAR